MRAVKRETGFELASAAIVAQGLSEVNKTAALAWQLSSPTRAGGSGDAEKGRYAIGSASAGARMSAGSGQL